MCQSGVKWTEISVLWHSYSKGGIQQIRKQMRLFFFFLAIPGTCRILVPWPGIEPESPVLGAQSLNHWTTRKVPHVFLFVCLFVLPIRLFLMEVSVEMKTRCVMWQRTAIQGEAPNILYCGWYSQAGVKEDIHQTTMNLCPITWPCSLWPPVREYFYNSHHLVTSIIVLWYMCVLKEFV